MKWFSIKGIFKEVGRIHWPSASDMVRNSSIVLLFIGFFAIYFLGAETLVSYALKLIRLG